MVVVASGTRETYVIRGAFPRLPNRPFDPKGRVYFWGQGACTSLKVHAP
jgi:hypothetical protein